MDFLKHIEGVRWWHLLIAIGLALALASLPGKDRAITFIGFGLMALGFGEWFNHPKEMTIFPQGTLTTNERKGRPAGIVTDCVGIVLLLIGIVWLMR